MIRSRAGWVRLGILVVVAVVAPVVAYAVVGRDDAASAPPSPTRSRGETTVSTADPTTSTTAPVTTVTAAAPDGGGASSGDCPLFPADNHWHAPVADLPVHSDSAAYVASIGRDDGVKADFGAGTWDGGPIGIPLTTVDGGQPEVPVTFDYADESDPGPYPIPSDARIEGGPDSDGDRHVLVLDRGACQLAELWDAHPNPDGSWRAGSGAVYDLRSNQLRPAGWTSADAAGLPILPGLVRYEEVASGRIDHAIRVTVPATQDRYVWPARHAASSSDDPVLPPMGLRLRLRADVDLSGLAAQAQVVARAMQTYGVIVADNGSAWYLSGVPDDRWDNDGLRTLGTLTGADFEAVEASSLMADPDSGRVA